ncbi:HlyD family secretion protein [Phaeovulum vinaykumarii]|uniref:Membrane fusion protein, multidrug efflux system n=1 Tax=Phaeovulum vinaykumarii TaxID=407234 RepID=A0A1N7KED8_9RHOB|nr:HlyD family secretion protein [Phaeovulum vinaykumarii]SIS59860.1 membrane fusion protein, multidrug efflux system [Phaeovulum vinaykumarii]SOB94256.1 membrane fusion protein (multidrug efflux system) [Phaeovulum vinaykumarii]
MSKPERLSADDAALSAALGETDAPARPKQGRKRLVLGALAALVLSGAGYAGWNHWTTGRFMVGTDDAYVQADIALISSRVQGYVAELPVEENTHVKAGDVLVRLDDGDYRIALATARSRVETADRTLARIDAQITAARAAVAQAEADRDAAEAQLRNATTTLERVRGLNERNVAAQAQLDSAVEGFDTATATLAKARAAVVSARAQVDVLIAQRAESEGAKHELELAVEQAQRDLDLTVLRAPRDGVVANLSLEVGDLVSPGTRLAALVPDDALYVEANFKETQLPGVAVGAHVDVTLDALPDVHFDGRVVSLAPATGAIFSLLPAENATGNFTKVVQRVPVRISLPPEAFDTGALRAGLSAVVEVDRRTAPGARG